MSHTRPRLVCEDEKGWIVFANGSVSAVFTSKKNGRNIADKLLEDGKLNTSEIGWVLQQIEASSLPLFSEESKDIEFITLEDQDYLDCGCHPN